jgi:hypothetical protein
MNGFLGLKKLFTDAAELEGLARKTELPPFT